MKRKVMVALVVGAGMMISGGAFAQTAVGGNSVPKYTAPAASKNTKVMNHGVGGNSAPSYSSMAASKNRKVTAHGVGGNAPPRYPATAKQ
jgi:hypothetical protein